MELQRYEEAIQLFEAGDYDKAVGELIEVYNEGVFTEEIINNIYSCFINPNEAEFKACYDECIDKTDISMEYESLAIDFIPVSEKKYYLFNKNKRKFEGDIEVKKRYPTEKKKDFRSLLIAGEWNLKNMLDVIYINRWDKVYIVVDDTMLSSLMSYFKLPGVYDYYFKSVKLFSGEKELKDYFLSNSNEYLPRVIVGSESERYTDIVDRLHDDRLKNLSIERNNIFLTIAIPTYCRGPIALKSVQNLLKLPYDSEIEILVSNNGSETNNREYEEIAQINDSRLTYFAFKENQGFIANVVNVLNMAKGRFVVIASDEDLLINDNLAMYLQQLYNNPDAGLVISTGVGNNFGPQNYAEHKPGYDGMVAAVNCNYLTGITFNTDIVRKRRIIERFLALETDEFVAVYPHIVLTMLVAEKADVVVSDVEMWEEGPDTLIVEDDQDRYDKYVYQKYDSRVAQQDGCIRILREFLDIDENVRYTMILERMWKTYFLLSLAFSIFPKGFSQNNNWVDMCMKLHRHNKQLIDSWDIGDELKEALLEGEVADCFLTFINKEPGKEVQSAFDNIKQKILADIISYLCDEGREATSLSYDKMDLAIEKLIKEFEN